MYAKTYEGFKYKITLKEKNKTLENIPRSTVQKPVDQKYKSLSKDVYSADFITIRKPDYIIEVYEEQMLE